MINFNKLVMAMAAIALSGTVYSGCPSIGGYTLSSDNQNRCTYTSNNNGSIGIQGQRAVHNCPRFIVTDPNYRQDNVGRCHVVIRPINQIANSGRSGARCQCSLVSR